MIQQILPDNLKHGYWKKNSNYSINTSTKIETQVLTYTTISASGQRLAPNHGKDGN